MIQEIYSFDLYKDFIEDFSGDPVYADPHFQFDDSNLYDALSKNHRKAYVVTEGKKVAGLFVWMILPDEKYIEMLIGLSKEASSIREMLAFMEREYAGCQLDFVINPQHTMFCDVLRSKQARFEEEQQWMAWEKEIGTQYPHKIVLLSPAYEAQYLAKHNKDTYWTAEKVMAAKDRFRVFLAVHEGNVVGYMDVTYCYEKNEPYDLWVDKKHRNQGYEQALLQAAIQMNLPRQMMVLADVGNQDEIGIFSSVGFVPVAGTNSIYATYHS